MQDESKLPPPSECRIVTPDNISLPAGAEGWKKQLLNRVQALGNGLASFIGATQQSFKQIGGLFNDWEGRLMTTHHTGQVVIRALIAKGLLTQEELNAAHEEIETEIQARRAAAAAEKLAIEIAHATSLGKKVEDLTDEERTAAHTNHQAAQKKEQHSETPDAGRPEAGEATDPGPHEADGEGQQPADEAGSRHGEVIAFPGTAREGADGDGGVAGGGVAG